MGSVGAPYRDEPNLNAAWARLVIETCVAQGVGVFVVAPGSRSTPLVRAILADEHAEAVLWLDERGAAFHALGHARATGRPAAVVTTSGTAVANLLPAAVEATADGVPLLLLTADRPAELVDVGANQAIRQAAIGLAQEAKAADERVEKSRFGGILQAWNDIAGLPTRAEPDPDEQVRPHLAEDRDDLLAAHREPVVPGQPR